MTTTPNGIPKYSVLLTEFGPDGRFERKITVFADTLSELQEKLDLLMRKAANVTEPVLR